VKTFKGKNQLETLQVLLRVFFEKMQLCEFNGGIQVEWRVGGLVNSGHNPAMWILSSFHLVQPKFGG
jgi:hypothetical protein